MILKKTAALLFFLFAVTVFANAQGKFGLGIIVGEPTGISGKYHLTSGSAIDGAIGWSSYKYGSTHIHADYLQNFANLAPTFDAYFGIGGRIKLRNNDKNEDLRLAVRVPVGITYEPKTVPIDLFIEGVPMLDLSPATEFSFNAGIGFRYYFN